MMVVCAQEGHAAGSSQRTVQPSRASVKESNDGFVCAGRTCSRQQPAHSSTQSCFCQRRNLMMAVCAQEREEAGSGCCSKSKGSIRPL
eukprot:scaffold280039_cov22-Tisochrysis_lutea.AAC.2